jgi:pilus assembly protein Flp/PilA
MIGNIGIFVIWVRAHANGDRGASLVEYALLMALIALVCAAAVTTLGGATSSRINSGATGLAN